MTGEKKKGRCPELKPKIMRKTIQDVRRDRLIRRKETSKIASVSREGWISLPTLRLFDDADSFRGQGRVLVGLEEG